jgi:Cdc6-like AAA superfamily ATPase
MKTTLVNIYGAPGSGKSTLATELYTHMKQQGESVELVRECIKKWSWQKYKPSIFEQIYITNQQMLEETALYGKVEYLITDSPIHLGAFYCNYYHGSNALDELNKHIQVEGKIKGILDKSIHLYLPIEESIYKEEGRYSSLEEAKYLDKRLTEFLKFNDLRTLNGAVCNRMISSIEFINKDRQVQKIIVS